MKKIKKMLPVALMMTLFLSDCVAQRKDNMFQPFMEQITPQELSAYLHFLASDFFEGRGTDSEGEKAAANYIASIYAAMDIPALPSSKKNLRTEYFQPFSFDLNGKVQKSQNVIAFIEGSDPRLKDQAIIFISHYDHLGKDSTLAADQIYNGAADDGSGTVAMFELAESFLAAKQNGVKIKRSVIFLHTSGEELGLVGSEYYANEVPLWPLEKTLAVINLDGVGGIDPKNPSGSNFYSYVLSIDSTSQHLSAKTAMLNKKAGINLNLVVPENINSFNSDNRPFESQLIPSIYFSTGLTEHYHKVTDEPETIDYNHMSAIVKLIFVLGFDLVTEDRIDSKFNRAAFQQTGGNYVCRPCGCSKDQEIFSQPGYCPACKMRLNYRPNWKRR